jgi:nucleoside-diphosphate-sugar epimerase
VVERIAALAGFRGRILWGALPAAVDMPLIAGDSRRLRALGWEPRLSLDEGLERTLAWMRSNDVQ